MKLSVLQWNVLYQEKAANILELVVAVNADVVCLQELTRTSKVNPDVDLPEQVKKLGYQGFYQAAIDRSDFVMGNGIFSKYPLSQHSVRPVQLSDGSGDYDKETRLYLEAKLITHGRPLYIGTTHLSYTDAFAETPLREAENEKLLSYLASHTNNFLFCGDFNATPGSHLVQTLCDRYVLACPPLSQPTWTTKPFAYKDFAADSLDWRLDYIFVTSDITVVDSKIIKTNYSDHLPILTDVEL